MQRTRPARSDAGPRMRPRRALTAGLALGIIVLPVLGHAAEPQELRLGSDSWPPFTGGPEGQGVALELVHTALERAGIAAGTTILEWREVEAGLRRGSLDGSAAIWRSERRERELLFSEPYLENRLVLVGRKGSDVAAARMSDLAGRRVAVVGRYAYGDEVERAEGVLFVAGRSDQEDLDRLLAGEVELMLVDELVVRYLVTYQAEEAAAKLEIGTTPLARRTLHLAVRKDLPGAEEVIKAFNSEIRRMLADGSFARILGIGWIQVDVDGDGLDELVPFGETVGMLPPGSVYDVFGEAPETPPEKRRIFVRGSIFEGWDAIPEQYKTGNSPNDVAFRHGATLFSLRF